MGGTCTSSGASFCSGQSGITHVIDVASYVATTHMRPPPASTVGAAEPLVKPVPVSVSVEPLMWPARVDAAVSVGVLSASRPKLHGSAAPVVESA